MNPITRTESKQDKWHNKGREKKMSSKILYLTKRRERGNNVHERKKERKKEKRI